MRTASTARSAVSPRPGPSLPSWRSSTTCESSAPRRQLSTTPRTRAHSLDHLMIRRAAPGGGTSGSIEPFKNGIPQQDISSGSPPMVHEGEEPTSSQKHHLENQEQCKEALSICMLLCVVDSVSYNNYNLICTIYKTQSQSL